jgi:GMP synthase (glutamine-hydrolysing)
MRGYVQARQDALQREGRCAKTMARDVSATPHARRVLRRFVRHARR